MADPRPDPDDTSNVQPRPSESAEGERSRVRASNDADQVLEREGLPTAHDAYDEVVDGREPGPATAADGDWEGDDAAKEDEPGGTS